MRLVSFTFIGLLACSSAPDSPSPSSEVMDQNAALDTLAKKWKRSQNQFTLEMKALSDMERLYVVRQILSNPKAEHSPKLCQTLKKQHRDYCMQMLGRSHIWDVPAPKGVVKIATEVNVEQCTKNDVWCLTSKAILEVKHGRIIEAKKLCGSLSDNQAREECFFQSAEQIAKQDRFGSLEDAFTFCEHTTAYREHCDAHIIEFAATTFQPPLEQLSIIEGYVAKDQVSFLQDYYLTMKARQSPFNHFTPYWDKHSVQTLIFLSTQSKSDHSLSHWIAAFQKTRSLLHTHELKQDEEMNNYWVQHGRAQHPSKLYLSLETRPFSEDESEDLQFAMVAGLIQRQFPVGTIKKESKHPTIQWMINRASHKR